jgi:hypothetical protein
MIQGAAMGLVLANPAVKENSKTVRIRAPAKGKMGVLENRIVQAIQVAKAKVDARVDPIAQG